MIIKRLLLSVALLSLASGIADAAGSHALRVGRHFWWDRDYLTVEWDGTITTPTSDDKARKAVDYIVSLVQDSTPGDRDYFFRPTDGHAYVGSRVLEIDGIDVKGWPADRFYEILDRPHTHIIKLNHAALGDYEVTVGGNLPIWMVAAGFHPLRAKWTYNGSSKPGDNYKIRSDKDVDWRSFKTYDYYVSSDDVLADKEILDIVARKLRMAGLKWDQENPDIVFTITKDASQSIEYNYVPETVERVQTGSVSTPIYGWKGKYIGSVTSNKYETVRSGGYTQKMATTTAYLEIDMMETSRLGGKTLPLIWQLKYNYNENKQVDADKLYKAAAHQVEWPVYDLYASYSSNTCTRCFYGNIPLYDFGIVLDGESRVAGLDSASQVVSQTGLRVGDRILAIDVTHSKTLGSHANRYSGSITVERNGAEKKLSFSGCSRTRFYGPIQYKTTYYYF